MSLGGSETPRFQTSVGFEGTQHLTYLGLNCSRQKVYLRERGKRQEKGKRTSELIATLSWY